MSSQKRIEANRRNALKSTGPKSAAGKAAASRNALLHGLRAQPHDPSPEEQKDLEQYIREVHRQYKADGPRETLQVRNLAVAVWRLRQLDRAETALFEKALSSGSLSALDTLGLQMLQAERAFYRAIHGLERLRSSTANPDERSQLGVGETAQSVRSGDRLPRLGLRGVGEQLLGLRFQHDPQTVNPQDGAEGHVEQIQRGEHDREHSGPGPELQ